MLSQFSTLNLSLRCNIRAQILGSFPVFSCHNHGIRHCIVFFQSALYLSQLYPVPSYLYLIVYPSITLKIPVYLPSAYITCPVQQFLPSKYFLLLKLLRRQFIPVYIPFRYPFSTYIQLSSKSRRQNPSFHIQHIYLCIRYRLSYIYTALFTQISHCRPHRCLRRTVHVIYLSTILAS